MFGWFKKSNNKDNDLYSKYKPSESFMERVRKREKNEKERLEKWRLELKNQKMSTYNSNISNSSMWVTNHGGIYNGNITLDNNTETRLRVDGKLEVGGRDVMKELDEMREAMLLLTRDLKLEEQYPELKQAYDDYMELYRGIKIADKFAKTGDT